MQFKINDKKFVTADIKIGTHLATDAEVYEAHTNKDRLIVVAYALGRFEQEYDMIYTDDRIQTVLLNAQIFEIAIESFIDNYETTGELNLDDNKAITIKIDVDDLVIDGIKASTYINDGLIDKEEFIKDVKEIALSIYKDKPFTIKFA